MFGFLKRFLGDNNEKEIKRYRAIVDKINSYEAKLQNLSDSTLAGHTDKFKERLAAGETLDQILPEAFAVTREASRRVLGMRHFDVQMIGGMCLHEGKIAEMKSDEMGNVTDYTRDGLLIGHLVRGVATLAQAAKNVGVEGEMVVLLEHMIISHHGEAEYGSPRMPMFPEAEVLHWIDTLDARMNEMEGIMARVPAGAFSEKIWSLDRRLYHPHYENLPE